jgi:hypothetical protein
MKAYTVNSRASSTIVYRVYPPTHVHIRMIICDTVNIEHEFVRDAIPRSPSRHERGFHVLSVHQVLAVRPPHGCPPAVSHLWCGQPVPLDDLHLPPRENKLLRKVTVNTPTTGASGVGRRRHCSPQSQSTTDADLLTLVDQSSLTVLVVDLLLLISRLLFMFHFHEILAWL